jgi:hypothetical protein
MGVFRMGSAWHRMPEECSRGFGLSEEAVQVPKFEFQVVSPKVRT